MSKDIIEESKIEDETSAQDAPIEETNEDDSKLVEDESKKIEESDAEEISDEIDYKAELEKVTESKDLAESKIVKLKKELKSKEVVEEESDEDDTPEVDIQETIQQEVRKATAELIGDVVDDTIASFTSNPDEQALIKHHYENTVRRSGTSKFHIKHDIGNAYVLANRSKLAKENSELKVAIQSRKAITNAGVGSGQKEQPQTKQKLSQEDKEFIARMGKTKN
jgi:hypothetical protein